jgi:hypothetical protein
MAEIEYVFNFLGSACHVLYKQARYVTQAEHQLHLHVNILV